MPYSLDERLVIGVASSAIFDLSACEQVFLDKGEIGYREYQKARVNDPLPLGAAFPFVKRILGLNDLSDDPHGDPLIEIVLLSKNDPDTGIRVLKSIEHYGLAVNRAIFTQGQSPYEYIPALNISLFLSANQKDVAGAIHLGLPAGQVLASKSVIECNDDALRIAFDFDGVIVDDEAEAVMHTTNDLDCFHEYEAKNVSRPLGPGPLRNFLMRIIRIQAIEEAKKLTVPEYRTRLRVSIVTARGAPAHIRALNTLSSWGVTVNDAFFLGGVDKGKILGILRPHIFFDDQMGHLKSTAPFASSVHVPFGIKNV